MLPLAIYEKFSSGIQKLTAMRVMMAERSINQPLRIFCDVLVKVDRFIFPADFVILDCLDFNLPIILGIPL